MNDIGRLDIDDSDTPRLEELIRFAATLSNMPVALVVVAGTGGARPASAFGLEPVEIDTILPRCAAAIGSREPIISDDAANDLRLMIAIPFAADGALCLFGRTARARLSPVEDQGLRFLARQAEWLIRGGERDRGGRDRVAQELSHRIKNIFSVIAGLIGLSATSRPELADLVADLRQRVLALGRAHDFVRPEGHSTERTRLCGLLRQLFAPYGNTEAPRVLVRGEDPDIDDRSATPLALIFHELATNAAKYGALSNAEGTVSLSIDRDGPDWRLCWEEMGARAVGEPGKAGFGSQLIALSLERQLGGRIEREWRGEGLRAEIRIPADVMTRSDRPG